MIGQNLLIMLVALPFLAAGAASILPGNARNAEAWISGLTMLAMIGLLLALYPQVQDGHRVISRIGWVDRLGLGLSFRIDGFAWLFMMLVTGIGFLIVLYARYYMSPDDPASRFYACLRAFAGAMSGVLLSGNIIMLVVFWELTSLTSFLLIGYWYHRADARDGARMALVVTGGGGVCLLLGMILLGQIVGSYNLDTVLRSGALIRSHGLYPAVLGLFLMGALTKSAQFPFHFWLPNAMAAPTPVSGYLHSATMVKAGVFLLLRFEPALGGTDAWFTIVAGLGIITMVLGAVAALFQHDLKGLLAYSTISHLGLITALAGIGSPLAIVAAVFHIVNHAIFKASLFMTAGIIDHETGSRDMRKLSGLFRYMPVTGTLAILGSAAMAGLPLLNGFLSKELFFEVAHAPGNGSRLDAALPWLATLGGAFSIAYSLRFVLKVFFGPEPKGLPKTPHEPPTMMRMPVAVLVGICVVVGIIPAAALGEWLRTAAIAIIGPELPYYSLKIWHGITPALNMTLIALALGTALYLLNRSRIDFGPEGPPLMRRLSGQRAFDWIMANVALRAPRAALRLLTAPGLQMQLRVMVLLTIAAVWASLSRLEWNITFPRMELQESVFVLLWIVGAVCAIGAAWQANYHRFAALILMGGAGLITCATFVWLSAPDLAVTQLLVEIVTTVLLLLGLRWMPKRDPNIPRDVSFRARFRRRSDLVIALACGTGATLIALAVMLTPPGSSVGDWFLRHSYSEGGGTNVVNVILVDFRAFDTFGEVTVLAIVGLTVFALLRRFRPSPESAEKPAPQRGENPSTLYNYLYVPSIIMQWLFAPIIALSAYLFFRGHDLPGGGFAAGVTLAIGLLLQYLATDVRWIEARLTVLPVRWMAVGLAVASATGAGAWIVGYPFLSQHYRYLDIPVIGQVPASTAMLFDFGVYALVVGSVVLMLIAIAHQSLRLGTRKREAADTEELDKLEEETVPETATATAETARTEPQGGTA